MEIQYPYANLENLPDDAKGDCPCCPKGFLSIDLKESFVVTIYGKTFSFEVVVCDRCDYVRLDKLLSESDNLEIQSD